MHPSIFIQTPEQDASIEDRLIEQEGKCPFCGLDAIVLDITEAQKFCLNCGAEEEIP